MKESIWGYAVIVLGVFAIGIIWFLANVTRTDQHNYNLLKETVEAAMLDAVDLSAYRNDETIRIDEEKFVENFIRRFAENADLSNEYQIDIYDISEEPPKVSLRVSSKKAQSFINPKNENQTFEFDVVNYIDAVLEAKYATEYIVDEEETGKILSCETGFGVVEKKNDSNGAVIVLEIDSSNEIELSKIKIIAKYSVNKNQSGAQKIVGEQELNVEKNKVNRTDIGKYEIELELEPPFYRKTDEGILQSNSLGVVFEISAVISGEYGNVDCSDMLAW